MYTVQAACRSLQTGPAAITQLSCTFALQKKKRILDNFYRSNASTELDQRPSTVLLGCVSLAVTHLLTLARTNMGSNHQLQPECLSPQPMQQLLFRTLLPKKTFGLELFLKHFIMKFSHSESDCSIV